MTKGCEMHFWELLCRDMLPILYKMGFTELGKRNAILPSILVLKLRLLDDPAHVILNTHLTFLDLWKMRFWERKWLTMSHSHRHITSNLKLVFRPSDLYISSFVQFHSSLWKFPRYNSWLYSIQLLLCSITALFL